MSLNLSKTSTTHWLRSDGQHHLWSGKFLSGDSESREASNSNPTHPPEPRVCWFGGQTTLQGLLAAVALPHALVNVSDVIDNTWSVVLQRADKAGRLHRCQPLHLTLLVNSP